MPSKVKAAQPQIAQPTYEKFESPEVQAIVTKLEAMNENEFAAWLASAVSIAAGRKGAHAMFHFGQDIMQTAIKVAITNGELIPDVGSGLLPAMSEPDADGPVN